MTVPLAVVGVSHETAPVEVRERVVFGPAEAGEALLSLREEAGVEEAVLLSTCNRTEVYLFPVREDRPIRAVSRLLAGKAGPVPVPLDRYVFRERGESAVRHLFHVSAGLDSMVTGEAEIQGQVKEAYQRASSLPVTPPLAGPVLNRLFQMALSVGGRVRSETSIGEGTASVASVAVELARKIFGSLKGKRALVLGAGMMGELITDALRREGVEGTVVATRTYERAESLASRLRGQAIPFESLPEALPGADIVLSSTTAPHPVLTRSLVEDSLQDARRHPLLIIDIAVPRDVEPAVGDEAEVFLYNIDDLRKIADDHVRLREGALPAAEEIIAAHSEEFRAWYTSLEVVPVIQALRRQADAVRDAELERLLRGLTDLGPEDRERIEEFARRLQNKLLHDPVVRLREGMAAGGGAGLVDAARILYGLGETSDAGPASRSNRDEAGDPDPADQDAS